MEFEWDIIKAKLNIKKHGVSFEEAIDALKDEFGLENFDDLHSEFEEYRYSLIGLSHNGVLYVIYTMRDNEGVYRIITARKAEKSEEKLYWDARYE